MNKISKISDLSPQIVWRHFETLCEIPRASKHEQTLRTYLQNWAESKHLETINDQVGNLIIRKAATNGFEHLKGVILQGHLDMVTQANQGTLHDFFKDPIYTVIEGEWLIAPHTTLGADNGIGVALALAVLESDEIEHGPIEVLLTVDEEAGMSGARLLDPNVLKGEWLFNIDTEEWGELYLGCAGSLDLEFTSSLQSVAAPSNTEFIEISVRGLRGGHSGVDIHLERGHANVILSRLLRELDQTLTLSLIEFEGGSARNAIAREASAKIAILESQRDIFDQNISATLMRLKNELAQEDQGLDLLIQPISPLAHVIHPDQKTQWLTALATAPYGVINMSEVLDQVVETSNNIGIIRINIEQASAVFMIRSMVNDQIMTHVSTIEQHFAQYDILGQRSEMISGWSPNPESAALKCLQQAYQAAFGIQPKLKVIHAGLECGIIAEHYPHLQMVSFGPDIRGAHAPGERVHIKSVEHCWTLLTTALKIVDPTA